MVRTAQDLIEQARLKKEFEKRSLQNKKDIEKNINKALRKEKIEKFKFGAKKVKTKVSTINKELGKSIKKTEKKFKSVRKGFKKITKAVTYNKKLSSSLSNIGAGFTGGQTYSRQQRVQQNPGRPRGDYKHRDPQTGQPIPAVVYYKRIKELRRQAQQQAQQVDVQQIQQYARRGISPQEAQQIINQKQLQSVGVQPQIQQTISDRIRQQIILAQQMQQRQQPQIQQIPQQLPNTYPSQAVRPIWRRHSVVREDWGLFGKKLVVQGNDPRAFWN